jgi:hypothetical protein
MPRHLKTHGIHGINALHCPFDGCTTIIQGRKDSLDRHIRKKHPDDEGKGSISNQRRSSQRIVKGKTRVGSGPPAPKTETEKVKREQPEEEDTAVEAEGVISSDEDADGEDEVDENTDKGGVVDEDIDADGDDDDDAYDKGKQE